MIDSPFLQSGQVIGKILQNHWQSLDNQLLDDTEVMKQTTQMLNHLIFYIDSTGVGQANTDWWMISHVDWPY